MSMTIEPGLQISVSSQGEMLPPKLTQHQHGSVIQIKGDETGSLREEVSTIREQFRKARSMSEKTDRLQALIGKVPLLRGEAAKEHESNPASSRTIGEGSLDHVISKIEDEVSEAVSRQSHIVRIEKDEPQRAEFLSIAHRWLATAQPEEKYHHLWELVTYYHSINDTAMAMEVLKEISLAFPPDVMKQFELLKKNPTASAIFAFQAANWNTVEEELTRVSQRSQKSVSDLLKHTPIVKTLLEYLPRESALALREVNKECNDAVTRQLSPKIAVIFARQAFTKEGFSLSSFPAVLRDNRLVVLAIVSRDWREYILASPRLQNDLTVNVLAWLRAKEDSPESEKVFLATMPKEIRESQEFHTIQHKKEILDLPREPSLEEIRLQEELEEAFRNGVQALAGFGIKLKEQEPNFFREDRTDASLRDLSEILSFDRDISLVNAMFGKSIPDDEALKDREIVLELLQGNCLLDLMERIASIHPPFLDDEEIACKAIRRDFSTFEVFTRRIRETPEIREIFEQELEKSIPDIRSRLLSQQRSPSLYQKVTNMMRKLRPW